MLSFSTIRALHRTSAHRISVPRTFTSAPEQNNQLLSTNTSTYTSIAATPLPTGGTLSSSTPYVIVLTITRTGASAISIASQINDNTGAPVAGYTNTATSIATNLTTTFDTFAMHALSNTVNLVHPHRGSISFMLFRRRPRQPSARWPALIPACNR